MKRVKFRANRWRLRMNAERPGAGRPIARGAAGRRLVALSFDDGPSAANTLQLQEVLARHGARATFFVVGDELEAAPEIARRTVADGHELANHTYTHRHPESLSDDELRDELERANEAIDRLAGFVPRLARPPFGKEVERFDSAARGLDLTTVMWSVDSGDTWGYEHRDVAGFVGAARDGDIVLLHDGGDFRPSTVGAMEGSLRALTERGFRCVTVSELLAATA